MIGYWLEDKPILNEFTITVKCKHVKKPCRRGFGNLNWIIKFYSSHTIYKMNKEHLELTACPIWLKSHLPVTPLYWYVNVAVYVNLCHHLASVVCCLFTFEYSPLKPHGQINRILVGSIYGRTSIKTANFVPIR